MSENGVWPLKLDYGLVSAFPYFSLMPFEELSLSIAGCFLFSKSLSFLGDLSPSMLPAGTDFKVLGLAKKKKKCPVGLIFVHNDGHHQHPQGKR